MAIFKNISIKSMVANIYVRTVKSTKQDCRNFFIKYLSRKYSLDDLAAVCSGYPLVSSKLEKILGFKGYLPLTLPFAQNQNWDSPYSPVNAQI